jgi:hypothetical protein
MALATCVLPVPEAPRQTTFSLAAVKVPLPSSSTRPFSSEGSSEKSKLSKLFSAGKRAALMRAARRCSVREATSAARQAASDSRCARPAF